MPTHQDYINNIRTQLSLLEESLTPSVPNPQPPNPKPPTPPAPADLAKDDTGSTTQGAPVVIPLMSNDDKANIVSAVITTQPANGKISAGTSGESVTYTPNPGFTGVDSFTYTVTGKDGSKDTATVRVTTNAGTTPTPPAPTPPAPSPTVPPTPKPPSDANTGLPPIPAGKRVVQRFAPKSVKEWRHLLIVDTTSTTNAAGLNDVVDSNGRMRCIAPWYSRNNITGKACCEHGVQAAQEGDIIRISSRWLWKPASTRKDIFWVDNESDNSSSNGTRMTATPEGYARLNGGKLGFDSVNDEKGRRVNIFEKEVIAYEMLVHRSAGWVRVYANGEECFIATGKPTMREPLGKLQWGITANPSGQPQDMEFWDFVYELVR